MLHACVGMRGGFPWFQALPHMPTQAWSMAPSKTGLKSTGTSYGRQTVDGAALKPRSGERSYPVHFTHDASFPGVSWDLNSSYMTSAAANSDSTSS